MIETKENKERWENFFVIKIYIFLKKSLFKLQKKFAAAAEM